MSMLNLEATQYTIRRIDTLSLAKMLAALHGMIGVVIGVLISISSLLNPDSGSGGFWGPMSFIILPLMNVLLGFVGGAIIALFYNFSVRLFGGIKIHLSDDSLKS